MARLPFLDWPGPLAFAHQGAHFDGATGENTGENTMESFEAAVALGYRYLETDTHATADGVLVAFHDDSLDRLTDRTGAICDLPWAEVRAARVRDRHEIPLLEDVLTAWPDVRVNIDPKHDAAVDPLVELIRRTGSIDRVCVGAFSDDRLARVRSALGRRDLHVHGPRQVGWLVLASRRVPGRRLLGGMRAGAGEARTGDPRDRPVRGRRPPPRPARCTCGRSTMPPRCTGCSTSASTAS